MAIIVHGRIRSRTAKTIPAKSIRAASKELLFKNDLEEAVARDRKNLRQGRFTTRPDAALEYRNANLLRMGRVQKSRLLVGILGAIPFTCRYSKRGEIGLGDRHQKIESDF